MPALSEQEEFEFRLRAEKEAEVKPPQPELTPPGRLEALGRGALQGVTLGYGDEAAGAVDHFLSGRPYAQAREEYRAKNDAAQKAHPWLYGGGELAGGIGGVVAAGPEALGLGGAAALGGAIGLGNSKADLMKGNVGGAAKDTAKGAALGAIGQQVGEHVIAPATKYVGEKLTPVSEYLSNKFGSAADELAERATGATAKERAAFTPGTGRVLREEGIVKPFSGPAGIASRAQEALDKSGAEIGESLSALDKQGVTIPREQLVSGLKDKIAALSQDESQAGVVAKLQKILERAQTTPESRPISAVETVKRGYQGQSNYAKPLTTRANKAAADVYRSSVEKAATDANPDLADQFIKEKQLMHALIDPQAAAQRRATQLSQQPLGGLLDFGRAATGKLLGDPSGGALTAAAGRIVSPRIYSTASSALGAASDALAPSSGDAISSIASSIPKIGSVGASMGHPEQILQRVAGTPYEKPLNESIARGTDSFSQTYFLLQQKDPNFRKTVNPNGDQ